MVRAVSWCTLAVTCVLGMSVGSVRAEEVIAPAKKALIQEVIHTIKATRTSKIPQDVAKAILLQVDRDYQQMMSEEIPAKTWTEPKFQQALVESRQRISQRFLELAPQRVRWDDGMAQINSSLYDKYFTEEELKDVATFYKSAGGQKALQIGPQLGIEGMQQAKKILVPPLTQLGKELMDEEKARLLKLQQEGQGSQKNQP